MPPTDLVAAYPLWVIRRAVEHAKSPVVERLLLDGPAKTLRPNQYADAFEEWLIERWLKHARSEAWQSSAEYEYLRAAWEQGH